VFNGSRFRAEIAPRIADFIATHASERATNVTRLKIVKNGKAGAR
jgi:hypothetical protein